MSPSVDNDAPALLRRLASDDAAVERIRLHMERLHRVNYGTVVIRRILLAAARSVIPPAKTEEEL